jgi:hypothetical protein
MLPEPGEMMGEYEKWRKELAKQTFCWRCGLKWGDVGFPECWTEEHGQHVSHDRVLRFEDIPAIIAEARRRALEEAKEYIKSKMRDFVTGCHLPDECGCCDPDATPVIPWLTQLQEEK